MLISLILALWYIFRLLSHSECCLTFIIHLFPLYKHGVLYILYSIHCFNESVHRITESSWRWRKGQVPPHALRDWPRYISVVIKAAFHVSMVFPIIFTLLLLKFKRVPPTPTSMWYSGEENSNKQPLRGNRFKMSQADTHPSKLKKN